MAVDEIQLFVHYGLSFRHQFAMLSATLFKDLKVGKTKTKIPVLFMTATCTVQMFEQLQTLTGLTFQKDKLNVFWPDSVSMQKRNIYTRVMYTNRVLQVFTSQVDPILSVSKVKSFIFYANTRAMIDRVSEKYGDWLDRSTHQSDYLKLTGTMKKEEKFHVTQLFCKAKGIDDVETEGDGEDNNQSFNPQVLFATSGAANAGIDNPDIYGVLRAEIPPSLEDCVQEQGRAGRRI